MSVAVGVKQIATAAARQVLGDDSYAWMHIRLKELRSNQRTFTQIYRNNLWGSEESVSGTGSTLELSAALSVQLPAILTELKAETLLDAGCGDFNWLRRVDLGRVRYIGIDVVEELIEQNTKLYGSLERRFMVADITRDRLPAADVVLCRHCLIHLPNRQIKLALRNLAATGAGYLLATSSPNVKVNRDIWPGSFRPINLTLPPFNLPQPVKFLNDSRTNAEQPELGLWRLGE